MEKKLSNRRGASLPRAASLIGAAALTALVAFAGWFLLSQNKQSESHIPVPPAQPNSSQSSTAAPLAHRNEAEPDSAAGPADAVATDVLPTAPGLAKRTLIAPLADSYRRIDPAEDGWRSEVFSEAAGRQLKKLAKLLEHPAQLDTQRLSELTAADYSSAGLRPRNLVAVFDDGTFRVSRPVDGSLTGQGAEANGIEGLAGALREVMSPLDGGRGIHVKFKLFQVEAASEAVATTVFVLASGVTSGGTLQINATWRCRWIAADSPTPLLVSIAVERYEEAFHQSTSGKMFSDCTEAVLGKNDSYARQLAVDTDHWRSRLARDLGLDVVANHGLAIGDVNGDGLDDLYVCQQGGLPNRLFLRNADGTLTDVSATSGADWLEYCASALLIDLDNDGDQDLVVAQEWRVLLMSNDGQGRFRLELGLGTHAQAFSMAAADYDQDGDLDIYVCGYNPSVANVRQGVMGEPIPYHDANNGGRNMLLRNEGNWEFTDVANEIGLDQNNTRFSFAAAWEDFDNDGDQDLYVANDYGRNNLYRNDGGRFRDVAAELGVEDMSAGMSASWADYNRDGWMDLYVSNMFSAAGNRITYQRQFRPEVDPAIRSQFQRHARGNSLFENTGDGRFRDRSDVAGVTMGRWAWGSRFVDLNNDGWEDLVVANGFITADDTHDL